jgi:histone H2B
MVAKGKSSAQKNVQAKKGKRRNFASFSLYIYKVLKSISNDIGISKKGMDVINSLVADMFEQVALEASKLVRYQKKRTLSSQDIQTAVKLLLPQDLGNHAILEGNKAVAKFGTGKR